MKKFLVSTILGVTSFLQGLAASEETAPFHFDHRCMVSALRSVAPDPYIYRLQRSTTGKKLYLTFRTADLTNLSTATITTSNVTVCSASLSPWYDDDGRAVIRFDAGTYILNGTNRVSKMQGTRSLSVLPVYGTGLVMLKNWQQADNWVIVSLDSPKNVCAQFPTNIEPQCAYATSNNIYVFGIAPKVQGWVCSVFSRAEVPYKLVSSTNLTWVDKVHDMNPSRKEILVQGHNGVANGTYVFNLESSTKRRIGFNPGDNLFLVSDLAHFLEKICDKKTLSVSECDTH